MKTTEDQIEDILRAAPHPKPPAGLKEHLIAQAQLPKPDAGRKPASIRQASGGWLRRWWPALATGACSLAGAAVLTVQRMEIEQLRQSVDSFSAASAGADSAAAAQPEKEATAIPGTAVEDPEQEVTLLKGAVGQLTADVARLEQLHATNELLRVELAKPVAVAPAQPTQEQLDAIAKQKARAERIMCVNNLKQLGLAVRVWANDNNNTFPQDPLVMTNEMGSPRILACPSDSGHKAATDWASCSSANLSYEYLAPSGSDAEPTRVLFLCRQHGNVGLCDGSVQQLNPNRLSELLVERDGKLYFEPQRPNPTGVSTPPPGSEPNPNQ